MSKLKVIKQWLFLFLPHIKLHCGSSKGESKERGGTGDSWKTCTTYSYRISSHANATQIDSESVFMKLRAVWMGPWKPATVEREAKYPGWKTSLCGPRIGDKRKWGILADACIDREWFPLPKPWYHMRSLQNLDTTLGRISNPELTTTVSVNEGCK